MAKSYWIFKSEPETYSFAQLVKDRKVNWNGVRNFQARNFLKAAKVGDLAFIYHSGDDKAVVGIAEVVREAYPDPDPDSDGWVQIDLKAVQPLANPVELKVLKADAKLKNILLVRQSRLSCSPLTAEEFKQIEKLGSKPAGKKKS
ncbi:MAG: EVE domain-containing protein [Bdellovibrionales bacterium]|nr:EVE domain-containing protein [Bdellovibrionales bacterium]